MNTIQTTAATGETFCAVLEALLVGSKVFQTFLSTVSNCDIFYAVDECSLNLCKYFCKGTDAVKSKQFCGTVIPAPPLFGFLGFLSPRLGFFVLYTLQNSFCWLKEYGIIYLMSFLQKKNYLNFFFFWFSLTCIHCKRLSCASSELVQNFLYL